MTVYIVEDQPAMRDALLRLIQSAHLSAEAFSSAEAFIAVFQPGQYGCLLLDVRLAGGMSGPDLQKVLLERGIRMPIVFLSAHGDIRLSVETIKRGAFEFLEKPVKGDALLKTLHGALEHDALRRAADGKLKSLTPREREVLLYLAKGHTNKEIARSLTISHRTVEIHRRRIILKTGCTTLSELVSLAASAKMFSAHEPSEPAPLQ